MKTSVSGYSLIIQEYPVEFHERVRQAFLKLHGSEASVIIDASQTPGAVQDALRLIVLDVLGIRGISR